jgi:hypothetical protein
MGRGCGPEDRERAPCTPNAQGTHGISKQPERAGGSQREPQGSQREPRGSHVLQLLQKSSEIRRQATGKPEGATRNHNGAQGSPHSNCSKEPKESEGKPKEVRGSQREPQGSQKQPRTPTNLGIQGNPQVSQWEPEGARGTQRKPKEPRTREPKGSRDSQREPLGNGTNNSPTPTLRIGYSFLGATTPVAWVVVVGQRIGKEHHALRMLKGTNGISKPPKRAAGS